MLEVLQDGADGVLAMRASGTLDKDDIRRSVEAFDRAVATNDKVSLFVELQGMTGMTPAGVVEDLRLGIQRIGELGKLDRAAVVADSRVLDLIARVEDKMLSNLDVRRFPVDRIDDARAWVRGAEAV